MTPRQRNAVVVGFVIGAVAGYLFFVDDAGGFGDWLAAAIFAIAAAAAGYYFARDSGPPARR